MAGRHETSAPRAEPCGPVMTKPLPFTESRIRRAVAAARKSGLPITATSIAPDGTVTIHHQGLALPEKRFQDDAPSKWLDVEA
jgi:hypothetical protein